MTNLIMRLLGLGKVVDALDGETSKAYQGAVLLILTGLGALLVALGHIAGLVVAAHGFPEYLAIAKQLYAGTSDTAALLAGLAMVAKGWNAIGQRHALAKMHAAVGAQEAAAQAAPPAAPPAPAQPSER